MAVQQLDEMLEASAFSSIKPKQNKKDEKKILLVSQELKIARALAGNDKSMRYRALKSLKRWIHHRSQNLPFTEGDFMRLWKGLFYSMWMSDKPLVQEECAENIASLLHDLPVDHSLKFFKCGLTTLAREWFGIDQLRLDKFMMFVRRLLRHILMVLKKSNFNKLKVICFGEVLDSTIFDLKKKDCVGLFFHFTEIFWEELAKVTEGCLKPDLVNCFLTPFIKCLATTDDSRITKHLQKFVFIHLMSQTNVAFEYQEKYNAWKREGFPGTIQSMQKVEETDNSLCAHNEKKYSDAIESSTDTKSLDPRAGRVDVELPQIMLNPKKIAALLLKYKYLDGSSVSSRKTITLLVKQFKKLSHGIYPLGVTNLKLDKSELNDMKLKKAVNRLIKFDNQLLGSKSRSKKRKLGKEKPDVENQKIEQCEQEDDKDNFDGKLQKFIRESEGSFGFGKNKKPKAQTSTIDASVFNVETPLKKKSKKLNISEISPESHFERNSGLWFVFNQNELDDSDILDNSDQDLGEAIANEINTIHSTSNGVETDDKNFSPSKSLVSNIPSIKKYNKKIESSNVKRTPKATENTLCAPDSELFPKNPWDEQLKDGEYEISIPSKSYVKKLKTISKKSTHNLQDLIENSLPKSRNALHSKKRLQSYTPQSGKRVKINTRLNQSQEFDDYHSQILTSPAIAFDASKKPGKPLLKTSTVNSPINPFYNQLYDL